MNQRLKAFSIIEIIMVLSLMSILISIVFSALSNFNKMIQQNTQTNMEITQFHQWRSIIRKDFNRADSIKLNKNDLTIFIKVDKINYVKEKDVLTRNFQNRTSICPFSISDMSVEFLGAIECIKLTFDIKNRLVDLKYPLRPNLSELVNHELEQYMFK